jgi:WD40 repeat protein
MLKHLTTSALFFLLLTTFCFGEGELMWKSNMFAPRELHFTPNENSISFATSSRIIFRNIITNDEVRILWTENGDIYDIDYSNDGKYLIAGFLTDFDKYYNRKTELYIWDAQTFELFKTLTFDNYIENAYPKRIMLSPDDKVLAIATSCYGLRFYNTETWEEIAVWDDFPIIEETGKKATVDDISYRYDGKVIAITSYEAYQVVLYDIENDKVIRTFDNAMDARFAPNRNELIVQRLDQKYETYFTKELEIYNFDVNEDPITLKISDNNNITLGIDISYSPDGKFILVTGGQYMYENLQVYRRSDLEKIFTFYDSFYGGVFPRMDKTNTYVCFAAGNIYMFNLRKYLDINEIETTNNNNLIIYPNPSSDFITINPIENIGSDMASITISNIYGESILELHNQDLSSATKIDVRNLPVGTYFLRIIAGSESISEKILKK